MYHAPEFLHPLSQRLVTTGKSDSPYLELSCLVVGHPIARCLFYKNRRPIPVIVIPVGEEEDENQLQSLTSFSRKHTVISGPGRQNISSGDVGYLRSLKLCIHKPTATDDAAVYLCRAWNNKGQAESSIQVAAAGSVSMKTVLLWLFLPS